MTAATQTPSVQAASSMRGMPHADADPARAENAILDLIEASIATASMLDLDAPLRHRLARLLPPPPVVAPAAGTFDQMQLTQMLTVVRMLARYRVTAAEHEAICLVKAMLTNALGAASGQGGTA